MNDKSTPESTLTDLKNVREHYRTKAFHMMIEVAFIFGIPAALAFFAGRKLDGIYETGRTIVVSLLAFAFVLSWVIVIIRYRKLDRELKKVDERIKEEMNKHREEGVLKKINKES